MAKLNLASELDNNRAFVRVRLSRENEASITPRARKAVRPAANQRAFKAVLRLPHTTDHLQRQSGRMKNLVLLTSILLAGLPYAAAQGTTPAPTTSATPAQPSAWQGLTVPNYPGATQLVVSSDDDEYELYFQSSDGLQKVFNYYRDFLVKQGFKVENSKAEDGGTDLKANLSKGTGKANNIELDVKLKNGQYKVEIEFDD